MKNNISKTLGKITIIISAVSLALNLLIVLFQKNIKMALAPQIPELADIVNIPSALLITSALSFLAYVFFIKNSGNANTASSRIMFLASGLGTEIIINILYIVFGYFETEQIADKGNYYLAGRSLIVSITEYTSKPVAFAAVIIMGILLGIAIGENNKKREVTDNE